MYDLSFSDTMYSADDTAGFSLGGFKGAAGSERFLIIYVSGPEVSKMCTSGPTSSQNIAEKKIIVTAIKIE